MFTNEFDFDLTTITIMDDTDMYEDVRFELFDDIIMIKQWNDDIGSYQSILMSPEMFTELFWAMKKGEGAYKMVKA